MARDSRGRAALLLPDGRKRRALHVALRALESALCLPPYRAAAPQLFILGLPRSGTTLLYQYITHCLESAYFTSGVAIYPRAPTLVSLYERARYGPYESDFRSEYGRVKGEAAPHEAGDVWARYFGYEEYIGYDDIPAARANHLRKRVACLQRLSGDLPFVNKDVKHLLRLDALSRIFPRALFLVVRRARRDVALSVLRARYANHGSGEAWWSVRPPEYERLRGLPAPEQVVAQLASLDARMEEDLSAIEARRIVEVRYEDFCAAPATLLEALLPLMAPVRVRHRVASPFTMPRNEPRTAEEARLLHLLEGHDEHEH